MVSNDSHTASKLDKFPDPTSVQKPLMPPVPTSDLNITIMPKTLLAPHVRENV